MGWLKFHKVVLFYHLKWLMDLKWTCLIFLEHYLFRGIIILCINKDKMRSKWNFAFWLLWDYMVNGSGADTQAIRTERFLSSENIAKIPKCAKYTNQRVGAKVIDLQMVVGFGFQEFKEQVCPGCYFIKDKRKRMKYNNWDIHRPTALPHVVYSSVEDW